MPANNQVRIAVGSDWVCPFCYLEEPVLHRIRDEYLERVALEWKAFELRPDPVPTLEPNGEYLRATWKRALRGDGSGEPKGPIFRPKLPTL
jgi:predicted DsbA family dithiol-disulfide isomerase